MPDLLCYLQLNLLMIIGNDAKEMSGQIGRLENEAKEMNRQVGHLKAMFGTVVRALQKFEERVVNALVLVRGSSNLDKTAALIKLIACARSVFRN